MLQQAAAGNPKLEKKPIPCGETKAGAGPEE
jgi:hypothetical protein